MRFFPLAAAIVFSVATSANADFILRITDDGTDLTMRATGTYDLSAVSPIQGAPSLGANAIVGPDFPNGSIFGWETGISDRYDVIFDGSLTGFDNLFPATSVATDSPFYFIDLSGALDFIHLAQGAPSIGTVNEIAVFEGVTLADLGMVVGETVTVTWNGDSAIITTVKDDKMLLGDTNCDGLVNLLDVEPFVLAISDPAAYELAYPDCDINLADCNEDGMVNLLDVSPFVDLLTGG